MSRHLAQSPLTSRPVANHWFSDIGDSEPQMMLSTGQTYTENRVG
jgi:hypothetical protein